jgi:hypothetical protein
MVECGGKDKTQGTFSLLNATDRRMVDGRITVRMILILSAPATYPVDL